MKKQFFCLFIYIIFISVAINVNAQIAISNVSLAKTKADFCKPEIERTMHLFEIVSKNNETFYKDFLTVHFMDYNNKMVFAELSSIKQENSRIIKSN